MKKLILFLSLLFTLPLLAQQTPCNNNGPGYCAVTASTTISGTVLNLNSNGGLVPGFNYTWSSGTGTVTLKGCINQLCDTLDAYTGGNTNRTVDNFSVKAPTTGYQYFTVTPTLSSGTFTVTEVNNSQARYVKSGGSVSLTASSPLVVSPNPITGTGVISCPTCSTGGSPGGSDTQGQFNNNGSFAGSPGLIFSDSTGYPTSFSAFVPNTAGLAVINTGFGGLDGDCRLLRYHVNQDPSSQMTYFVEGEWDTNFVNQVTHSWWQGWNLNCFGGFKVSGQSYGGLGLEYNYTPGGTPGGVWPPTAQGQSQDEFHYMHTGISGPYVRPISMAFDTLTGYEDFYQTSLDVGQTWQFGISDAIPITGVTVTMSGATATFNFGAASASIPYNYQAQSYINVGCAYTGLPSCTNFSPSGYDGVWTIQTVGSTTLTATKAGTTGLSSGSGGTVIGGGGGKYASLSPQGNFQGTGFGGFATNGPLNVSAGGAVIENAGNNANAGFFMLQETGQFGGSNATIAMHAGGTSGITPGTTTCSTVGLFEFPGTTNDYFFCDGTHWQLAGSPAVKAAGLYSTASGPLAINSLFHPVSGSGMGVALTYTSDTNWSGWFVTSNGTGQGIVYNLCSNRGGGTAVTDCYIGGDSGGGSVATHLVGGLTQGLKIDTSGNVFYGPTTGVQGVTAGSFSAITAIATTQGGVTTLTGTSDARLKTDIHPDEGSGLEAIMPLIPYVYGWNAEGQKITGFPADLRQLGFIAQNVQESIPEAIGHETHDGVDYLTIADRPILAKLVKAVQEQQAQIESLKKQIQELETH